jgi:hypothetical protein
VTVASAKSINDLLDEATDLLDRAAGEIRDAPLSPTSKNIGHVAEALSQIFEIQLQIHALYPELAPDYMNHPSKDPAKHFEVTLGRVRQFEALGERETAVAFLKQFIAREPGSKQCALAEHEIARIEGRDA